MEPVYANLQDALVYQIFHVNTTYQIFGEINLGILGMDESITIILPLPSGLLSPNHTVGSIGGRFAKAGAIKKYRRLAKEAVEAEQIDTSPWDKVLITSTFFFAQNRVRDSRNALGSLKSAYDGIVDADLIENDDYEHVQEGLPIFEMDRKHPRVELAVTRIED